MSICASYRRLPSAEFDRLHHDQAFFDSFFGWDRFDEDDPDSNAEYSQELAASEHYLDIQDHWHALHFLLTGRAEMDRTEEPPPLGNVVLGGTPTPWEATYGWVRSLTPEEVADVALALEKFTDAALNTRFQPAVFNEQNIYQGNWSEESWPYLLETFHAVRAFFQAAAQNGEMIFLSSD